MFEFSGFVSGSQLQSIYQLGTAVALAFIVAGPAVRTILAKQLSDFNSLRTTLKVLSEANVPDAQSRIELCDLMQDTIDRGELETVRVNPYTNIWYVAVALVSFAFLVACSVFQTIPVALAWLGIVVVNCVLFVDPIRIALISSKISDLISLVNQIAKYQDPNDPRLVKVTKAKAVIAYLKLGSITLEEAIMQLNGIQNGNDLTL
ncbi:MAG: hypothetical protein AAGA50_03545 [Pseudomonadota bacterium]